jgi:hypothetical protein
VSFQVKKYVFGQIYKFLVAVIEKFEEKGYNRPDKADSRRNFEIFVPDRQCVSVSHDSREDNKEIEYLHALLCVKIEKIPGVFKAFFEPFPRVPNLRGPVVAQVFV